MDFVYQRSYRGPLKGVILDWAGTTMDFGCMATGRPDFGVWAYGLAIGLLIALRHRRRR